MARTGITFDDVSAAAESVLARGQEPTISGIRQELGDTGSMTTIQRHLSAWRSENKAKCIKTNSLPDALEVAFRSSLEELWRTSQQIAQSDIEEIRRSAQTTSQELRKDLAEACDAFDRQSAELSKRSAEVESLTIQREHLTQTVNNLTAEKAELERRFEEVVSRLEGRLMELTGVIENLTTSRKKPNRKTTPPANGRTSQARNRTPK